MKSCLQVKCWRAGMLGVAAFLAGLMSAEATTYYVKTTGSDSNNGTSDSTPFLTIQKAANLVNAGDTVLVYPGVYFETVRLTRTGTSTNKITFKATSFGKNQVVISKAVPALRNHTVTWTLEDAATGVYSTPLTYLPSRVLYDDTDLMYYKTFDQLKNNRLGWKVSDPDCPPDVTRDRDFQGPTHGFAYDGAADKLYVRLKGAGSLNPSNRTIKVSPAGGGGSHKQDITSSEPNLFCFGVETSVPAHVILDGFTFETPGTAGVWIQKGDVTIRNSWFSGCRTGVSGWDQNHITQNVLIEYCDYSNYPVYDDAKLIIAQAEALGYVSGPITDPNTDVSGFFWWERKGGSRTYEIGITCRMGQYWEIKNNYIHDNLDGISTFAIGYAEFIEIANNRFERLIDNAVETEDHGQQVDVHDNFIKDVFEPFSCQPLNEDAPSPYPGDIWIHHNVVNTTTDFYNTFKQRPIMWWKAGLVKLKMPLGPVTLPLDGFNFYNNSVHFPHGRMFAANGSARASSNFHFQNNIVTAIGFTFMQGDTGSSGPITGGYTFSHNVAVNLEGTSWASSFAGTSGIVLSAVADVKWADQAGDDFNLLAASPAINRATTAAYMPGATEDAGAAVYGVTWTQPVTGPQTTVTQVATPTFNPAAGSYTGAQSVTIATSTSGATIRYTTDGSTPTATTGTVYSTAVAVNASLTLKAIAYKSGMTDSTVASAAYTITGTTVATPSFSPGAGTYTSVQSVAISTSTSGATIRYTTDGSTPTSTTGTIYSTPVSVGASLTLKAIGYKSGMTNSAVASAAYTINIPSAPAAPSGLTATTASSSQINLGWTDNSSNETNFSVDYSTSSTFASGVTTLTPAANTVALNVTGLTANTAYYFRVKAVNAAGSSAYTSTATATTSASGGSDVIVDNGSAGFTTQGTWTTSTSTSGYVGSNYVHDGNVSKGAKWAKFSSTLSTGMYEVGLSCVGAVGRATNVPVVITHAGGTTTVTVNQETAPQSGYVILGNFSFNSSTAAQVQITTTGTDNYVIADAVRFRPVTPYEEIIDNTHATKATSSGTWTSSTSTSGYVGTNYMHDGNTSKGSKWFRFTTTLPTTDTYQVGLSCVGVTGRATNVPVVITHAGGTTTVIVNQATAPQSGYVNLGTFTFNSTTAAQVQINTTGTDNYVIADAVKFTQQ